jgi:hypothetical protein
MDESEEQNLFSDLAFEDSLDFEAEADVEELPL